MKNICSALFHFDEYLVTHIELKIETHIHRKFPNVSGVAGICIRRKIIINECEFDSPVYFTLLIVSNINKLQAIFGSFVVFNMYILDSFVVLMGP